MNTKKCLECGEVKPTSEYHKGSNGALFNPRCKPCRSQRSSKEYKKNWFQKYATLKRSYCKANKIPFDLDKEYLESIWTDSCPVTGNAFIRHEKTNPDSPALDRLDPTLGYVKGNVVWISSRMNRIKYDASLKELQRLVEWFEGATTIPKGSTLKRVEAPYSSDEDDDIV